MVRSRELARVPRVLLAPGFLGRAHDAACVRLLVAHPADRLHGRSDHARLLSVLAPAWRHDFTSRASRGHDDADHDRGDRPISAYRDAGGTPGRFHSYGARKGPERT